MTLINDISTFNELWKAGVSLQGDQGEESFLKLPERIQKLLTVDKPLTLSDLSHDTVKELLVKYITRREPAFLIDDGNQAAVDSIVRYLRRDPEFLKTPGSSFEKGLFLRGGVGTGKTLLLLALKDLLVKTRFFRYTKPFNGNSRHLSNWIETTGLDYPSFTTSGRIVLAFNIDGHAIFTPITEGRKTDLNGISGGFWIIDDLGTEPPGHHYGSKVNVISELLMLRYENFTEYRIWDDSQKAKYQRPLTFATTNYNTSELQEVYGTRVFDRIIEMMNDIILHGESRRK